MDSNTLRETLLRRHPLPPLLVGKIWRQDLTAWIEKSAVPPLVRAGLFLFNDDIERCHAIAQASEGPDGNYWHAILHRREGEFENSKYWYLRIGAHPVAETMRSRFSGWDPFEFVDRVAEKETAGLEAIQAEEMRALLEHVGR